MRAFMSGKIRVDGDLKLAVNLPNVVNMVEGCGIVLESPVSAAVARVRRTVSAVFGARPSVDPMPPHVRGVLPWVGADRALVTTYGHGKHTCPVHRFSSSAIRHATCELFRRFDLTAGFDEPLPLRRRIGGVARADRPCEVAYETRARNAQPKNARTGARLMGR